MRREDLPGLFAASSVVTVPSLCLDVFPTMNLEAMALAKPVIGTVFGGTPEIVER
jgi:glycosyltransferase involved in cell wall biosynthesis